MAALLPSPFDSPANPIPLSLTPEQEMDLIQVPEKYHAEIFHYLTSKTEDENWTTITTVPQAHAHAIKMHQQARMLKDAADPVVSAKVQKEFQERIEAAESNSNLSSRAIANERYIAACIERKTKLKELNAQKQALKLKIRTAAFAPKPISNDHKLFLAWAEAERAKCEAYILAHKPADIEYETKGDLQMKLLVVESEMEQLEKKLPQFKDYL
jgi:hypothetical protein